MSAAIDHTKQLLWHEADALDTKMHYEGQGLEAHAYKYDDMFLVGFLWKKKEHQRRWFFITNLHGRSYPAGAVFVPVYAEVKSRG